VGNHDQLLLKHDLPESMSRFNSWSLNAPHPSKSEGTY
jgi:hypothetical protein